MNKLLVVTIALLSVVAMPARAQVPPPSVTIHVDAVDLFTTDTLTLAPQNTVGLLVVDTTGAGFAGGTITAGSSIAIGAKFNGGNLQIISKNDIATVTTVDGWLGLDYSTPTYPSPRGYPPELAPGMKFGIIWLPNQTLADNTLEAGTYGIFSDGAGTYSSAWVLPPVGATFLAYDMTTVSESGAVPNAMGVAAYTIIPEPSSLALVALGLPVAIGLVRRRR